MKNFTPHDSSPALFISLGKGVSFCIDYVVTKFHLAIPIILYGADLLCASDCNFKRNPGSGSSGVSKRIKGHWITFLILEA
jgi:hypothetical protein